MVQIAVIGGSTCSEQDAVLARTIGSLLARNGATVVCGGLGGIMSAVAQGASEAHGLVLGILPGVALTDANPYVTCAVATGMGHARNLLVVQSAQAVIALPGSTGTLSEIALALTIGRAVIDLGGWSHIPGLYRATSAEDAVAQAIAVAEKG